MVTPQARKSTWLGCSKMCLGQNLDMGITPCPHLVVLVRGCWQGAIAGEEVGVADADVEALPADTLSYFYKPNR